MKKYRYSFNDLWGLFPSITHSRLYQFRTAPGRAKQLLIEGEDFIYEKTKILYSNSAVEKLYKYYEKAAN